MSVELLIYLNGEIVEESNARISPFDRGFLWGDGVYEITPCFNRGLYRLNDHLDRLYRSLRYVRIDPGMQRGEMEKASLDLLRANLSRLKPDGLYKLGHWVTRGIDSASMLAKDAGPATVCIFFRPMDLKGIAKSYKKGVRLTVVPTRRYPPECVETRAKTTSKLNLILAELQADVSDSLSLMLDIYGNVAENSIANFFMVKDGTLLTPPEGNILMGVTRRALFELATRLGIPWTERHLTMYDVAQADEFFITSSAICAMPVREVDLFRPKAPIPGPVTRRLIEAFAEETGFSFSKHAS
jgi:branched-chain amino acid aminotransferase